MENKMDIESFREIRDKVEKHSLANPSGVANIDGKIVFFGPHAEAVKNDFVNALTCEHCKEKESK